MWFRRKEPTYYDEFLKLHTHLYWMEKRIMAAIDDLKVSADAAVADLADLRSKVADIQAKLDAAIANSPPDDTAAIQAISDELKAAVAIDAPPAPPADAPTA